MFALMPSGAPPLLILLPIALLYAVIVGAIMFLIALPFMILVFCCSFYRHRFQPRLRLWGIGSVPAETEAGPGTV